MIRIIYKTWSVRTKETLMNNVKQRISKSDVGRDVQ